VMDVTTVHDDVVKRRNMVQDAKDHAPYDGEGQKEADRSDKQPPPWTLGDVLAEKRAKTSAAKNEKQSRNRGQKNRQENPVALHGPLNRDWDTAVILRSGALR
jgi:hypothetical protein